MRCGTKINSEPSRPAAPGLTPETTDLVMLVRPRKSRIYFLRRFFDYPIKLTGDIGRGWRIRARRRAASRR